MTSRCATTSGRQPQMQLYAAAGPGPCGDRQQVPPAGGGDPAGLILLPPPESRRSSSGRRMRCRPRVGALALLPISGDFVRLRGRGVGSAASGGPGSTTARGVAIDPASGGSSWPTPAMAASKADAACRFVYERPAEGVDPATQERSIWRWSRMATCCR